MKKYTHTSPNVLEPESQTLARGSLLGPQGPQVDIILFDICCYYLSFKLMVREMVDPGSLEFETPVSEMSMTLTHYTRTSWKSVFIVHEK